MSPERPQGVPSLRTLKRWSKAFNWQERVIQRDIEVARGSEREQIASIIRTKANYRKEIAESLKIIRPALAITVKKLKKGTRKGSTYVKTGLF